MSFYKKYELDRLMADGDAKTFRAVENSTGRVVFLHLFNPSGQPLLAALKSKLGGAKGKPVAPLIEIGEFAGAPYAVTQAIEPFGNLREWIAQHVPASNPLLEDSSPALAAPTEVPLAKPVRQPPSAPLLTDLALPARAPAQPPPLPVAPAPPSSAAPGGLVADGPGEFTRLFREPPAAPAPSPSAPSGGLVADAPGEFTRLFREPPAVPAPSPSAAPGGLVADGPGEFTRLFRESPAAPVPSPSAAPGDLVADTPGEFTRLFREPPAAPAPSPSAPPGGLVADAPGEFTRLFREPPAVPAAPVSAAPGGPVADASGDFTRLFHPPPAFPTPLPAVPVAPKPPVAEASGLGSLWPPPSPDAGAAETGQFTRLFGSRLSGEAIDIEKEHLSAARSAPPENRPFQQAGEFTRRFGPQTGAPGTAAPAPDDAARALNTSTRLPSASGMFGTAEEVAKVAAAALAGGKQPDAGPGEYTLLFDSPKKAEEPTNPATPNAAPPEAVPARKSPRDLIVIVVSVVVLVSLIIVAIVLRRR